MKRLRQFISFIKFLFVYPVAMIFKIFIKNTWLVCEDRYEARDNGYWLYKYIRENHRERIVHFAIDKKSPDYQKIKKLGFVVQYNSIMHWFWYILSSCNISSQASGRPENGIAKHLEKFGIIKTKFCFLQHGVIINDLKWLYAYRNKIDWFLTSAQPEYDFIQNKFGYKKDQVKLLGLPRFDNLHDNITDKDEILFMPTWRTWIKSPDCTVMNSAGVLKSENFEDSDYYKTINNLLKNKKLINLLKVHNKHLIFYPHRNMQSFIDKFSCDSKYIKIARRDEYDVQQLLKRCSVLITDYSSVFMDVVYMQKPVLFYQFDEKKFRAGQYNEGYFNYHNNPYSLWADDSNKLINNLELLLTRKDTINYNITDLFPLYDTNNCKRVYDSIASLTKRNKK